MNLLKKKYFQTQLIFAFAFSLLYIKFEIYLFIFLAVICLIIGLFLKNIAIYIEKLWVKFGIYLGSIFSVILLFLVYYLVLFPLSILYKVFTKKTKLMKYPKSDNSNFIKRNYNFTSKDFEDSF